MAGPEGWLARLSRVNPTTIFLAALVFIVIALFAPGAVGGVLLLFLALVLGALALHSPRQTPGVTMLRLVATTLVLALALAKIL